MATVIDNNRSDAFVDVKLRVRKFLNLNFMNSKFFLTPSAASYVLQKRFTAFKKEGKGG